MQKTHGFTLVELLVVIAIIGILAGIVAPKLFRAMDTAKEQQCRNNLRQLQAAVVHYAADRDDGLIPFAQTFERHGMYGFEPNNGWVVWVPKSGTDDPSPLYYGPDRVSHAPQFGDDLGFGEEALFAIRNGTLFDYVGDTKSYACPVTVRNTDKFMVTNGIDAKVCRSYAMNQYFGAACYQLEWSGDQHFITQIGVTTERSYTDLPKFAEKDGDRFSHIPQADRLLLFADVLPSPKGERIKARTGPRDTGHSPFNCCIAPKKFNEIAFDWKGVSWPGRGGISLGIPKDGYEMVYGLHDPLVLYEPNSTGEKPCYVSSALAVFFDGHIEKVSPVVESSDGIARTQANTAWFLNRGLRPSETKPQQ